jgi:hypothetical protein
VPSATRAEVLVEGEGALRLLGSVQYGMPPEPMSQPCGHFFVEHIRLYSLTSFVIGLVEDAVRSNLAWVNLSEGPVSPLKEPEKTSLGRVIKLIDEFLHHNDLVFELMFVRYVDNFLTYISDLLALIFKTRPETLKSGDTVRVEDVLSFPTVQDFVESLTERKILQLSTKGFSQLESYLSERLGFELFKDGDDFLRAKIIIEVRNVFVHNRGIANKIFASRAPEFEAELGKRIRLSKEEVVASIAFLTRSVVEIDTQASQKFGTERPIATKEQLTRQYVEIYGKDRERPAQYTSN